MAMEGQAGEIVIEGFTFISNFDSANLARVELVPKQPVVIQPQPPTPTPAKSVKKSVSGNGKQPKPPPIVELPDFEFNIWTNPDCGGTEYENANRTWFYFGVRGGPPFSLVKLNVVDLNKQSRMYREGMAPVCRIHPGRTWERIRDKPVYTVEDNVFTLSFKFRTLESPRPVIYFAFTYPYSYVELQSHLQAIDAKMNKYEFLEPQTDIRFSKGLKVVSGPEDLIYYHREIVCHTLEGRRVDLITISSNHNVTEEREPRLRHLFPDKNTRRCFKFRDKKVIFLSARVHPGETPSSFVLNGLLNLLVSRDDPVALLLRRQFVFKLIPMLNPDGVARGHYRTDTRGANLNRFYLRPSFHLHPSIYAARSLIQYYHLGEEIFDEPVNVACSEPASQSDGTCMDYLTSSTESLPLQELSIKSSRSSLSMESFSTCPEASAASEGHISEKDKLVKGANNESGLFLYIDMHGHASKKGIFIYGNHFTRPEDSVECMLFPKIMSINSQNFHFGACNFTERNMYLRDKRDGTSREGCGRVAVLRLTGTVRSYTLECNYNTGRVVNSLPQCSRELPGRSSNGNSLLSPPKYSPNVYEEIGRAIGFSILDLTNSNPWSRIPNSEFHTISGVRDSLRGKNFAENFSYQRNNSEPIRPKRQSQVAMALRPPRTSAKSTSVRITPVTSKPIDPPEHLSTECETASRKETSSTPSQQRAGSIRLGALKKIGANRTGEKPAKFKFGHKVADEFESEKKVAISTVSLGLNCPDSSCKTKVSTSGEPCTFKQGPKRLKMSKGEGDMYRSKKQDLKKEMGEAGPIEVAAFSKLPRTIPGPMPGQSDAPPAKKRVLKPRPQLSPLKYKKSLEKRRNVDTNRKKSKNLFKKASKILVSGPVDITKGDRKRKKDLTEQ